MPANLMGTFLIAIAATFWATDALFRAPLLQTVSPLFVVLFEHVVGVLVLLCWSVLRNRGGLRGYSFKTWLSLFVIGAGGSAIATVLFTVSFQHINPSIAILLQKLQPIMVIVLAFFFLGEKPMRKFWAWALVALLAAIGVSFPRFDFHFLSSGIDFHAKGVVYALMAAAIWAAASVIGKSVTHTLSPTVITFWRYIFGFLTLATMFVLAGDSTPVSALREPRTLRALLYIAAFPGLAALLFYYSGLKRASAISATFTELLFPVAAVILNWIFLGASLNTIQLLCGVILLYAVSKISIAVAG